MNKKILIILILIINTLLADSNIKNIAEVKQMVLESKNILPKLISKNITLYEIDFKEKNKILEYHYQFSTLNKQDILDTKINEVFDTIIKNNSCFKETSKNLFNLNININHYFYDKANKYTFKIITNNKICTNFLNNQKKNK